MTVKKIALPEGLNVIEEVKAQPDLVQAIIESLVGKVNGANATAEDIRLGKSAWVGQNLVEGTLEPITGIDFGEVTLASSQSQLTVEHKLGVKPKLAIVVVGTNHNMVANDMFSSFEYIDDVIHSNSSSDNMVGAENIIKDGGGYYYTDGGYIQKEYRNITATDETITFASSNNKTYSGNYRWFALA